MSFCSSPSDLLLIFSVPLPSLIAPLYLLIPIVTAMPATLVVTPMISCNSIHGQRIICALIPAYYMFHMCGRRLYIWSCFIYLDVIRSFRLTILLSVYLNIDLLNTCVLERGLSLKMLHWCS